MPDWFHRKETAGEPAKRTEIPDGVWSKCDGCGEIVFQKELLRNLKVCPKCDYHFPLTCWERVEMLTDGADFDEADRFLASKDPLCFVAAKSYEDALDASQDKTGLMEAVITGRGPIEGRQAVLAVMDFSFVGGSMGSVVGEKVTRAMERARDERLPFVAVSASGGARMQEGMYSLMQMAKTSATVAKLRKARVPFVSVLTHPTTGGVTASFAGLGDVIIAEPRARIGFAGPRVIEQTIRQKLPKDFQMAESMLKHGLVDMVVHRIDLKHTVARVLTYLEVN